MCRAAHKASLCDNANLLSGVPRDNVPLMLKSNPLFPLTTPAPQPYLSISSSFSVKFVCATLTKSLHIAQNFHNVPVDPTLPKPLAQLAARLQKLSCVQPARLRLAGSAWHKVCQTFAGQK